VVGANHSTVAWNVYFLINVSKSG